MFKRLTDTDKWKKNVWFRKLPKDYKLLWLYVNDDCDNVGVWEVDLELANILMGTECELEKASEIFEKRIYEFTTENDTLKWFVKNFCDFQYSGKNKSFNPTSPANIPQQSYVELLKRHGLLDLAISISKGNHSLSIPYAKGTRTHIDNDIDNDIDNEVEVNLKVEEKREKKLRLKRNKEQFELIWSEYPKKREKKPGLEKYLVMAPDEDLFNLIYADITERAKSHDWRKEDSKYVPLMTTYLNQERWNDEMFAVDAPAQERNGGRGPYIEDEEDD